MQERALPFDTPEQTAELVATVGWDGIECPVRAKGQIEPERAQDDLPKYAEALRLYNQNDALQGPPAVEADGTIRPGAVVSIPEAHILEILQRDRRPDIPSVARI